MERETFSGRSGFDPAMDEADPVGLSERQRDSMKPAIWKGLEIRTSVSKIKALGRIRIPLPDRRAVSSTRRMA